jgi:hypothetical protein
MGPELHPDLYKRYVDQRLEELRRDAAKWQLLQQGRRERFGPLARRVCWLLCEFGRWLVRVGEQLQAYGRYQHGALKP